VYQPGVGQVSAMVTATRTNAIAISTATLTPIRFMVLESSAVKTATDFFLLGKTGENPTAPDDRLL
jgi:hypothetical protein